MSTQQLIPVSEAVIVRQDSLSTIISAGPQSYQENSYSCQRCTEAGQRLLDEIERNGMSDDLDQRLAAYVEKTRKTLKAMNERRSPVTKLFDQVRSEFTILENAIDPTKKDTIPYRIAQYRNAYAAQKREEEERRRKAELAAQELIRAKETYRVAVEEDFRRSFNTLIDNEIGVLSGLYNGASLENFAEILDTVAQYQSTLPDDWCPATGVRQPYNLSPAEAADIRNSVFQNMLPKFKDQYIFDVDEYRREILNKLPAKKAELERIAKANDEEVERLKAELAEREAAEASRKERERQQAEAEAQRKAELDKANAEMAGLFAMSRATQDYAPKTKVTKRIKVNEPAAFLAIVSMWWQREGCTLSIDELSKIFKKQLTFCEKIANKDNVLVESAALEYIDEVKAQ